MVFMSAEKIGVGQSGWPATMRSELMMRPSFKTRVMNSGTLFQT